MAFPDFGNVLVTHCIDSEANPLIRDFLEGLFIAVKESLFIFRYVQNASIFYGQADRKEGGGHPFGPDRKQM